MSSPKRRRLSDGQQSRSSSIGVGESAWSPPLSNSRPSSVTKPTSSTPSSDIKGKAKQDTMVPLNDTDFNHGHGDDDDDNDDDAFDRLRSSNQSGARPNHSVIPSDDQRHQDEKDEDEDEQEHCAVCLSPIVNQTIISPCMHGQFCFTCIKAWSDQSRKCPLCLGKIVQLFYNIRSTTDYSIFYLHRMTTSAADDYAQAFDRPTTSSGIVHSTLPRHALYGRRTSSKQSTTTNEDDIVKREERALERRRYIYREGLYAKHVASNRFTGFKPFTPQQFANNPELKAKVIKFVRRELQVFPNVDVSFLTTYIVSICSQLDLRSSSVIRLLSDFISPQDAEHLSHEILMFARSPFQTLEGFDRMIQYGRPTAFSNLNPTTSASEESRKRLSNVPFRGTDAVQNSSESKFSHHELLLLNQSEAGTRNTGHTRRHARGDAHKSRHGSNADRHDGQRRRDDRDHERYHGHERGHSHRRDRSRSRDTLNRRRLQQEETSTRVQERIEYREVSGSSLLNDRRDNAQQSPRRDSASLRRSVTPSESDAVSFGLGQSPKSPVAVSADGRWDTVKTDDNFKLEKDQVIQLAIFGAAQRRQSVSNDDGSSSHPMYLKRDATSSDNRIIDEKSLPQPSSTMLVTTNDRHQPTDHGESITRATTAGPSSDLRAKLQARLTAEYRAALANRSQLVVSSTSTKNEQIRSTDLTTKLEERLRKEKQLNQASHCYNSQTQPVRFSQQTRRMLLARLEEEKAFLGLNHGSFEQEEIEEDNKGGETAYSYGEGNGVDQAEDVYDNDEIDVVTEPSAEAISDGLTTEQRLRQRLQLQRATQQLKTLERQTSELKERLFKAKLMKARATNKVT
ncbi:hypothetical protein OIO90_004892 [Microbotryomycetes sp. JL221]|nr:hypothetical protein OIO90_004892 [Microbotryomycetes sp. JL221]